MLYVKSGGGLATAPNKVKLVNFNPHKLDICGKHWHFVVFLKCNKRPMHISSVVYSFQYEYYNLNVAVISCATTQ